MVQDTEISSVNGKAEPPRVSTDCVKPEDAKDPAQMIQASFKDQAQQCKKLNVKETGNVILFEDAVRRSQARLDRHDHDLYRAFAAAHLKHRDIDDVDHGPEKCVHFNDRVKMAGRRLQEVAA